ncbi:MAG: lysophospholipase [Planctomycetes bacterium]|nr:lysophospholipase [Planctomycetota bacterium]
MGKGTTEERFELVGAGGVRIACRSWTPPAARATLALVHGLGEHCGRYGHLTGRLAREGFAAYGLDHRGHGLSGGRRGCLGRFSELTGDLGDFLSELRRRAPGPLVAYGHSMGAAILLRRLLDHDDGLSAAVASAPPLEIPMEVPWVKRALAPVLSTAAPWLTLDNEITSDMLSRDPEVARWTDEDPLVHHRISARLYTELVASVEEVKGRAGPFPCPLLLVHGEDDPIASVEGTRAFHRRADCPRGKALLTYPGYRHEVHNERGRDRPLDEVAAWLLSQVGAAART